MSTRCQVIVCDQSDEIWFYHHWDGYPSAMIPQLQRFLNHVRAGLIRDNAGQAAGWLLRDHLVDNSVPGYAWKASDYEPCAARLHGDIEWLYRVNVATKTLVQAKVAYDSNWRIKPLSQQVFVDADATAE